jgi:hypothetical protein
MFKRDGAQDGRQRVNDAVDDLGVVETVDYRHAPHQDAADPHIPRAQENQAPQGERQNRGYQHRLTARRAAGNRSRARPDMYSSAARRWCCR